ncbi:MAG TPA: FHA domain-containing protein, partial [Aggregatilineaceae bacterium]|nr:FHA domain-containing protein [Aggregatilineaceae bacterium]
APYVPYEPPPAQPDSAGFVRQTFEGEIIGGVTEIIQRPRQTSEQSAVQPETGTAGLIGYLSIKEPHDYRGTCLPIKPNQSIGREGDVRWNDPKISRQHARVTAEPPEDNPDGPLMFYLWPFGPTNPVFINGKPVRGATPVYENDEIRLGDTLFVLKVLAD